MMRHARPDAARSHADYTPIALMNFDPNAVFVRADSPIKDAKELLDAVKADPGKLKGSGTGQGGIWHLGLAGMLVDAKLPANGVTWVPSQGAAPGPAGPGRRRRRSRVGSLPEARSLIDAGQRASARC